MNGNLPGYREGLRLKYGPGSVEYLDRLKNKVNKIAGFEYKAMIRHYKEEVKRLKTEKGLPNK